MPIYTGKSPDGSDMKKCLGMFVEPCGNIWTSSPPTVYTEIVAHLVKYNKTLFDEALSVSLGTSTLSKAQRDYVIMMANMQIEYNKYEDD